MNRAVLVCVLMVAGVLGAMVATSNAALIAQGVAEATPANVAVTGLVGLVAFGALVASFWIRLNQPAAGSDKKPLPVDALLADACRLFVLQGEPGKAERLAALIQELAAGKPGGITKAE